MANLVKHLEVMFTQQMELKAPSSVASLATKLSSFWNVIIGALLILQNQFQVVSSELDNLKMRSRRKTLQLHEANNKNTSAVQVIVCRQ